MSRTDRGCRRLAHSCFRHPDLMVWVRANRGRIVAACLTLCQAWIAAGKPHGTRTIGSYESWAQVLGGVLETAGIEGFLGNLDEIMEASDEEGAAWGGFVGHWWDRFGTAEVGASDLMELALIADPQLPVGREGKTPTPSDLGRGISRMRDRVFDVDGRKVRLTFERMYRRSQRWALRPVQYADPGFASSSRQGCEGCEARCEDKNVAPHNPNPLDSQEKTPACEDCEDFPDLHACVGARARARESGAQTASQGRAIPAWLREVLQ